jgi:hypothetical protein
MWNYINSWVEPSAATCTCGWLPHSTAVISAKAKFVVMPAKAAPILVVISAKAEIQDLNGIARLARDLNS